MWVCSNHVKEALDKLEIPHIRKATINIPCALCENRAVANIYYAHQPFQLKQGKKLYSLSEA